MLNAVITELEHIRVRISHALHRSAIVEQLEVLSSPDSSSPRPESLHTLILMTSNGAVMIFLLFPAVEIEAEIENGAKFSSC